MQLTQISKPFRHSGTTYATYECSCGTEKQIRVSHVKDGRVVSCGCFKAKRLGEYRRTHGQSKHPLHGIWRGMKSRCENPNVSSYKNYGGRGIKVCQSWQAFSSFFEWATRNGWEQGVQIDRINNDGDYEPENCRFSTAKQNSNNRRTSRFVLAFSENKTLSDWSRDRRCVVEYSTLKARINRGWSPEESITTPLKRA